jgi:hypothetical protein
VKKCPALPLRDRQRALLQFHELPLPDNMAHAATAHGPAQMQAQMQSGPAMSLPFTPSKQLSALETLAEVSRQHLDLSGPRMPEKQPAGVQASSHVTHAGLLEEFLIDDRPDGADMSGLAHGMDMSSAPAMSTMYQFNGPLHHSPTNSPHLDTMPLSSSASMTQMVPSLVMAASAANDLMPMANGMHMEADLSLTSHSMNDMSDKYFQAQGRGQWQNLQPSSLDPLLQEHTKDELGKRIPSQRPIAVNPNPQTHFTSDFSVSHRITKPKVRGRFSDSRRKEVQEVRKRGACIRCRMLKKPCSGENPCNTCQNVESARLWKQPCIRTRIAEEFSLYTAGLHGMLAHHAVYQAKGLIRLNQIPGRIEATHYVHSGHFATFTPLKCQQMSHPQNTEIDPGIFATLASPDLELIDTDDDISGKMDLYIKKVGPSFFETEESDFMRVTVQTALCITSPSQDYLLSKVLELWNYTRILTSRKLEWHLFSNPSLAPTLAPPALSDADQDDPMRSTITAANHPSSYRLIKMQLMGATEKRAACLARVVMNDLERRLLQRQQANPFETFLVAVILLACVERMCWLYRTWEVPPLATPPLKTETSQKAPTIESEMATTLQAVPSPPPAQQPTTRHPQWPLDKTPAAYSQQGERFSDILNMLLKMRGVPPKPIPRNTDGTLIVWADDADAKVKAWYEGIAVTTQLLDEKVNAKFVGEDPREWELKFVGKIVRGD